jgi:hypothetical protein
LEAAQRRRFAVIRSASAAVQLFFQEVLNGIEQGRGRVGGPLREITFEAIVPSAWRGVPTKVRRALQNHFELPPDELAWVCI